MLYELAQIATWRITKDGDVIWSKELYDLYGMKYGDLKTSVEDFKSKVYPADYNSFQKKLQEAVKGNTPFLSEARIMIKGHYRWVRIVGKKDTKNGGFIGCTQLVDKYYRNGAEAIDTLKVIEVLVLGEGQSALNKIKAALDLRQDFSEY